jgi:predicted transcriptional regulator
LYAKKIYTCLVEETNSVRQESAEVLSDPDALSALEEGLAEIERGETITLAELRSELAQRRQVVD